MLVTLTNGLQINASRIELCPTGINGENCDVLVYFNSIQDVVSIPNPDEDLICLRPYIANDGKDPHVITMYVAIQSDLIDYIKDGKVDEIDICWQVKDGDA